MHAARLRAVIGAFALSMLVLLAGTAYAVAPPRLALLLPDTSTPALQRPEIAAWIDAVREQGYELTVYDNARFLADGSNAVLEYRGIIVPDQSQTRMSDELVAALKQYVSGGGQLMLVYDAGALTSTGFYPIPKSRFSDMVGVDYVLYDSLREFTIGLGPTIGKLRVMRALHVPPGKSWAYPETQVAGSLPANSRNTVSFLPSSPANPGGLAGYDHGLQADLQLKPPHSGVIAQPLVARKSTALVGKAVRGTTPLRTTLTTTLDPDDQYLATCEPAYDTLHTIVSYGYDVVSYPSYVTQGTFTGETLLSSPHHGLMAGVHPYGTGRVLFVNLPLVYLKLRTDGMLMHGFIDYFARRMLNLPRLTPVPNGMGGLILNWHLDSQAAQQPTRQLMDQGVWKSGPFSIHMTAGPDTKAPGDGLGWNLPDNTVAQQFLRDFIASGHQVGSHGGWIHDYYGINASETNEASFKQYLLLNDAAVTAVLGRPSLEYSAPLGNNPLWAIDWLECNGVTAFYFLGHTGMAPTRAWRDGMLTHRTIWAIPLTTYGTTATFEEWQARSVPKADIQEWYDALIAFTINHHTTRLIYAHPPGAAQWPDVLQHLLDSASRQQQNQLFQWYTMTSIALFMTDRERVTWSVSSSPATGAVRVTASHPTSLAGMTWVFRRSAYSKPLVISGSAHISEDTANWVVRAQAGCDLQFEASPL
jgi:hypothetical protein